MQKSTTRVLSLLLVLVMVFGLVACGGSDSTTGTTGTTGTTNPTGTTGTEPTDPTTTPPTEPTQPTNPTEPTGPVEDEYFLPKEEGCNQVTLYWAFKGDYTTASFWIWPEGGNGFSYAVYPTSFGVKCMVNIPKDVTRIGFIAIYGCDNIGTDVWPGGTKDFDGDRFLDITGDDMAVYLKAGDGNIYYSDDGGKTLYMNHEIKMAGITSFTTIRYMLNAPTRLTDLSQVKVYDGEREVEVTRLSSIHNEVNNGIITLAEPLDLSKVYTVEIDGYGTANAMPNAIFDTKEFIENYTYDGDDLGATINGDGSTTFKVWAPTASKVVLNLFTAGNGIAAYDKLEMNKADRGIWELTVPSTGHGIYYTYSVTTAAGTQEAVDPYAKATGVNGNRGMVVDLNTTNPMDWINDQVVTLEKYSDATIWEIHVRDFSNKNTNSQYPGKYLAFTERGLTNSAGLPIGVDYLLQLGVTHLHMLPVFDYASVDETTCNTFNWGYDPKNYNVPEGSYSTDPYNGEVRILEFKQMVQSLHKDGLGVIMDVVYNHTYDANSNFNKIVPYYYYRYDANGANTSKSGCGNDTASERYMFRKFMVDSVSYWAKEYHLDGFRFDLMGLHDVQTMQEIEKAVHAINPNAIIYGEAWDMAGSTTSVPMMTQANAKKVTASEGAAGAIAVFNDTTRDGLKGSVWDAIPHGYINGNYSSTSGAVKFGIAGAAIGGASWTVPNANVINYMSCHDNMTLWDILLASCPNSSVENLMARNRLGIGVLMISQGVPFWQAGEEILRTKNGNHNSYNASDAINNIDWEVLTADSNEYAMMRYYQGLIEMRKAYDIFRSDGSDVNVSFSMLSGGGLAVRFTANDGREAIVLINPSDYTDSYNLSGEWKLIANGNQAGSSILSTDTGAVTVDAMSILVYVNH